MQKKKKKKKKWLARENLLNYFNINSIGHEKNEKLFVF
jgi:hypothetical protein